jgi:hypothetical protein
MWPPRGAAHRSTISPSGPFADLEWNRFLDRQPDLASAENGCGQISELRARSQGCWSEAGRVAHCGWCETLNVPKATKEDRETKDGVERGKHHANGSFDFGKNRSYRAAWYRATYRAASYRRSFRNFIPTQQHPWRSWQRPDCSRRTVIARQSPAILQSPLSLPLSRRLAVGRSSRTIHAQG